MIVIYGIHVLKDDISCRFVFLLLLYQNFDFLGCKGDKRTKNGLK